MLTRHLAPFIAAMLTLIGCTNYPGSEDVPEDVDATVGAASDGINGCVVTSGEPGRWALADYDLEAFTTIKCSHGGRFHLLRCIVQKNPKQWNRIRCEENNVKRDAAFFEKWAIESYAGKQPHEYRVFSEMTDLETGQVASHRSNAVTLTR